MPRSGFLTSSIGNFLRGNSDARSAAGAPAEIRVVRPENLRGRQTCCPQILAWESNVSEYQYYEFLAVDRPLDERQQAELRAVSARADITATSFVSEYHWGRFHGDPRKLMEQCFDAYLYLASWGTHQLMIRLPAQLLDLDAVRRYCVSDTINSWRHRDNVLIELRSEAGNGGRDGANETPLSEIVPIRADLAAGDYRALYIAWLLAAQSELDDDEIEPPVPPALGSIFSASMSIFLRPLRVLAISVPMKYRKWDRSIGSRIWQIRTRMPYYCGSSAVIHTSAARCFKIFVNSIRTHPDPATAQLASCSPLPRLVAPVAGIGGGDVRRRSCWQGA
jgi:hypothetical protein